MKVRFLSMMLFAACMVNASPSPDEGKAIFMARCASCHNVNKPLTGPALAGIEERRTMDWIVSFVHSSQKLIQTGDEYAVALFHKYNKVPMPDHADLTPDNIKSVLEYIKKESSTAAETAPFVKPAKKHPSYTPLGFANLGFFIGFVALVGLLIAALLFAVQLKAYERSKNV